MIDYQLKILFAYLHRISKSENFMIRLFMSLSDNEHLLERRIDGFRQRNAWVKLVGGIVMMFGNNMNNTLYARRRSTGM